MNTKKLIAGELASVIDSLDQEAIFNLLEQPKNSDMGDIAFPAFSLAKVERKAPQVIAADIAAKINSQAFEKVVATGPYVNFSLINLLFLVQLSKKSSKKVLTTPNKRKAKSKILRSTFLVPISPNPSQSATCVQQLSEMPSLISLRRWATKPLKSTTLETGGNSLVFSWLLIRSGVLKKPSKPTQSMSC